jgi:acyl-[acyl-carrier-protein]-phospholipid O-acyltransferase/long-chain-fatty-acid--[acyl-carrier-protein] ligase
VSLPDAQKGEQLVLLTTHTEAGRAELLAHAKTAGLSEIHVPKKILKLANLPLLGSGKIDYGAARQLAENAAKA